jgi:hypothetical protein
MARISNESDFTEKVKFDSPITIDEMIETLQELKTKLGWRYENGPVGDSFVRVDVNLSMSTHGATIKAVSAEYRGSQN